MFFLFFMLIAFLIKIPDNQNLFLSYTWGPEEVFGFVSQLFKVQYEMMIL